MTKREQIPVYRPAAELVNIFKIDEIIVPLILTLSHKGERNVIIEFSPRE
jgi:hypothetical protein